MSHRQYVNKWVWLHSSNTLFIKWLVGWYGLPTIVCQFLLLDHVSTRPSNINFPVLAPSAFSYAAQAYIIIDREITSIIMRETCIVYDLLVWLLTHLNTFP